MPRLAFYVDWPDRFRLLCRLAAPLTDLGWQVVQITNKLSHHWAARRYGLESELLVRARPRSCPVPLDRTREAALGTLTPSESAALFWSTVEALERLLATHRDLRTVVVWNGQDVVGFATTWFAATRGLATLFLETANLPGKLFADPAGVGPRSRLSSNPSLLDEPSADDERLHRYHRWRDTFLESKRVHHTVPQATTGARVDYAATVVNHLGFRVLQVPTDDHSPLIGKYFRHRRRSRLSITYDTVDLHRDDFVFFPLQVAADTQVLLDSAVDNIEGLRIARERADQLDCRLYVKLHPAERDPSVIARYSALRDRMRFELVDINTFRLLEEAREVVTINSTAGLEALICGTEVTFLGRTIYRELDREARLASYVEDYLIDIDPFSDVPISEAAVQELLRRAALVTPPADRS